MEKKPSVEECELRDQINRESTLSSPSRLSRGGKIVLGIGATTAVVIYGLATPFILPGFRRICLPYVPATSEQIQNVLHCLRGRTGSCIDLGSGDGRIIFELSKHNRQADYNLNISRFEGVELNIWLVLYSKYQRMKSKQSKDYVNFFKGDIMKTDLGQYDNIVVFGVESLMDVLEPKLLQERKPGCQVTVCRFPFPNLIPDAEYGDGHDKVWIYRTFSNGETAV